MLLERNEESEVEILRGKLLEAGVSQLSGRSPEKTQNFIAVTSQITLIPFASHAS